MFCDQISCITSNTSTIDKLKQKREKKEGKSTKAEEKKNQRSSWQNLCEVMTGDYQQGFSYKQWLWPSDITFPIYMEKEFR